MSSIRFGRGSYYQFYRREDIRTRWDLHSALQFLNGFRSDATAMAMLRRQVSKNGTATSQANVPDEQIVQTLARMLVSGELVVAYPNRQRYPDSPPPEAEAPPAAPPPRQKKETAPIEDEPTFDGKHDGVAQAAVLIQAARSGIPFCEECSRAAKSAPFSPAQEEKRPAPPPPPPPPPPPKPAEPAPPPPVEEPEEEKVVAAAPVEPSFGKNADGEAQAAVLFEAAKDGTPFCEECERAAELQEAKQ